MASASQAVTLRPTPHLTGRNGLVDKYFYLAMALLAPAIVIWGFSHSISDNLIHATIPRPRILWFHAAVFTAWLGVYLLQSLLVRTHNVRIHRTLGWFGAALAVIMVPLGIATALAMGHFHITALHEPGAEVFEMVSFYDMLAFTTFVALGIYYRRQPEFHRRLFFLATCGLLAAAFGRIDYLFNHSLFYVGVDAVILLGVLRDLLVNRTIHKVYRIALPLLVIAQYTVVHIITHPPAWWIKTAHNLMA